MDHDCQIQGNKALCVKTPLSTYDLSKSIHIIGMKANGSYLRTGRIAKISPELHQESPKTPEIAGKSS